MQLLSFNARFSVKRVSQKLEDVNVRLNQEIFRASQNSAMFCRPRPPLWVGLKMRFLGYTCLEEFINFIKIDSSLSICFLFIVGIIVTMWFNLDNA